MSEENSSSDIEDPKRYKLCVLPYLEKTPTKFIQNNGGYPVHTFSEAFDKLHNAEIQELAGFTDESVVPQSLREAMNVESAEANYEKTYETLYGKGKSISLQKGAAYLPVKDSSQK